MIEYFASNPSFADLHITQYGIEQCSPGHHFGPAIRDYYLIHFILGGKGTFEMRNDIYHLEQGQAFLIPPGIVTYYQADGSDPWKYAWVGFQGIQAEGYLLRTGLSGYSPILYGINPEVIEECVLQMEASAALPDGREFKLSSLLYKVFAHMAEITLTAPRTSRDNQHDLYIQKVIQFIDTNYAGKISIAQIADFVGLNRSYLCAVFKSRTHSSIQQYLIQFRMNKACGLMRNRWLSIADIARSVGYDDPLLFSKMFKKNKGLSPRRYRSERV
ncbi:AraC family transcriptional regulator [Paenibacillus fonticola]|uniref:AraC family transcriptional regulator n=1 Tax=Paenibacillus fonticola TaxID=379896 RepID=UPI000366E9BB|nr:AraC family transcriptional regulator [Paenibacillus fonticola]